MYDKLFCHRYASFVWYGMCQLDGIAMGEINGNGIILHPISLQTGDKALKLDADTLNSIYSTMIKRTNIKQDKWRTVKRTNKKLERSV